MNSRKLARVRSRLSIGHCDEVIAGWQRVRAVTVGSKAFVPMYRLALARIAHWNKVRDELCGPGS